MKTNQLKYLIVAALLSITGLASLARETAPSPTVTSEEKEADELPTDGKNLVRPKGGWLNVQIAGTQMTVKFFDEKKKPIPPDVPRAAVRLRYAAKSDIHRSVLSLQGDMLVSPSNVRPPHNFLVTLTLLQSEEASDDTGGAEVHNFKFP